MGGTCTNDGCVPTRVLARAARLVTNAKQHPRYGLSSEQPRVDFRALIARTQETVYTIHEKKQLIHHLDAAGIRVFSGIGDAYFVDEHTLELPLGRTLRADRFILCAGGRARRLDFPGEDIALTHSGVWGLQALPESVLIVGGAATGCQLATIFNALGAQVTVLERADRLLGIEDDLVSATIAKAFQRQGIEVVTGIGNIVSIEKSSDNVQKTLNLMIGEQPRSLDADAILLSTGWLGNLSALNLAAAGVKHNGRYVEVDEYLQTSKPHIFAAGDITGRIMLVQSAAYQARVAAENAVVGVGQRYRPEIVPHGGFTEPEYASVGFTEAQARADQDCVVAVVPYADLDRAVIDGRTEGFCKLIVSHETHRLLGVHVVGEQALEIVHVAAAGMAAGMWVEQLAELEIAYPTLTAILGLAARAVIRQLGVVPLSPQWRSLGRPVSEWEHAYE